MKTFSAILFAALLTLQPTGCKSPEADIPCRCGTPLADLEGCAHAKCSAGKANPDNPQCVCGEIDIPSGKGK